MLSQNSPIHCLTLPYSPTPTFWAWSSPVMRHIKFASPMGLSLQWWPTRPSFDTYAARDKSSGVLVSSYCCSTYRVAVPFSSLGNISSSCIGGRVIHPIADCDHPLLCLLGPGIVSQETAIKLHIFKKYHLKLFLRSTKNHDLQRSSCHLPSYLLCTMLKLCDNVHFAASRNNLVQNFLTILESYF